MNSLQQIAYLEVQLSPQAVEFYLSFIFNKENFLLPADLMDGLDLGQFTCAVSVSNRQGPLQPCLLRLSVCELDAGRLVNLGSDQKLSDMLSHLRTSVTYVSDRQGPESVTPSTFASHHILDSNLQDVMTGYARQAPASSAEFEREVVRFENEKTKEKLHSWLDRASADEHLPSKQQELDEPHSFSATEATVSEAALDATIFAAPPHKLSSDSPHKVSADPPHKVSADPPHKLSAVSPHKHSAGSPHKHSAGSPDSDRPSHLSMVASQGLSSYPPSASAAPTIAQSPTIGEQAKPIHQAPSQMHFDSEQHGRALDRALHDNRVREQHKLSGEMTDSLKSAAHSFASHAERSSEMNPRHSGRVQDLLRDRLGGQDLLRDRQGGQDLYRDRLGGDHSRRLEQHKLRPREQAEMDGLFLRRSDPFLQGLEQAKLKEKIQMRDRLSDISREAHFNQLDDVRRQVQDEENLLRANLLSAPSSPRAKIGHDHRRWDALERQRQVAALELERQHQAATLETERAQQLEAERRRKFLADRFVRDNCSPVIF